MEEFNDSLGDVIFASITGEDIHGSPFSDVIREGVDELFGCFDAIGITDKSIMTTEELAIVEPSSTAGVSEKMVSVATASLHLGMLKTGLRGLK